MFEEFWGLMFDALLQICSPLPLSLCLFPLRCSKMSFDSCKNVIWNSLTVNKRGGNCRKTYLNIVNLHILTCFCVLWCSISLQNVNSDFSWRRKKAADSALTWWEMPYYSMKPQTCNLHFWINVYKLHFSGLLDVEPIQKPHNCKLQFVR